MVIKLEGALEAKLNEIAQLQGLTPESLAISILEERVRPTRLVPEPSDEWERLVLGIGKECGVSLAD